MLRIFLQRFIKALLWFAGGSIVLVLIFRVVPPPGTA
ncbi:MAG: monofunctional biosynthetic peptidoglycan transglycosylase, partial [Pseudomonadota bacterium]|nr:monofunctional biosynthetic peptidoglycan transglycosylase [Pseudomonadota bacterium]